jgi:UPF0271 protein
MKLDLNCDLGEGESSSRTRALVRWITSANVACGGHAGDAKSMDAVVRLAAPYRVRLGAHPGVASTGFGREPVLISASALETLLLHQVGALELMARRHGIRLHHIKLHGALYHAVEAEPALARAYLQIVGHWWPQTRVYARAGGLVARLAETMEVEVWGEVFADRAYRNEGTLVPRAEPGALITNEREVGERVRRFLRNGAMATVASEFVPVGVRTICVHGDTPGAARLVRTVALALGRRLNELNGLNR